MQDLLTTVNTPEWPAAELLLSLLGKLLVSQFANKGNNKLSSGFIDNSIRLNAFYPLAILSKALVDRFY